LQVPERALTTWLVLDVSPSMAFGTADRLKSDVAEGRSEVAADLRHALAEHIVLTTDGDWLRSLGGRLK
jgi:uncharacterized protein (DUF58 family)